MRSSLGQAEVKLGSSWGQVGVNIGSTCTALPVAAFMLLVGEEEGVANTVSAPSNPTCVSFSVPSELELASSSATLRVLP